jgi:hypothetical protein
VVHRQQPVKVPGVIAGLVINGGNGVFTTGRAACIWKRLRCRWLSLCPPGWRDMLGALFGALRFDGSIARRVPIINQQPGWPGHHKGKRHDAAQHRTGGVGGFGYGHHQHHITRRSRSNT